MICNQCLSELEVIRKFREKCIKSETVRIENLKIKDEMEVDCRDILMNTTIEIKEEELDSEEEFIYKDEEQEENCTKVAKLAT